MKKLLEVDYFIYDRKNSRHPFLYKKQKNKLYLLLYGGEEFSESWGFKIEDVEKNKKFLKITKEEFYVLKEKERKVYHRNDENN